MNSDNPYQSPRSDADAEDPAQPANVSVVRILLGFGAGMLAGMATWIGLLLVFLPILPSIGRGGLVQFPQLSRQSWSTG